VHSPTQTAPRGGVGGLLAALDEGRDRTLSLVSGLSEEDLDRVHSRLMSPLAWDLGHIAAFEDLWLCRACGGLELLRPDLALIYDADETPRAKRGALEYLPAAEVRDYMAAVRDRSHAIIAESDCDPRLIELVLRHEQQHNETMLQTFRIAGIDLPRELRRQLPNGDAPPGPDMVKVEAGPFEAGSPPEGFAYDNERPRHVVDLPAFEIDRLPVTVGDWLEFMDAEGAAEPLHWNGTAPDRRLPVVHVSWDEASAYARFRGKRLPTEAEWEKAASWDPATGASYRYPWGDAAPSPALANLDQTGFGPAPAGAYPDGASPSGALGMVGDAWEWTATEFAPYEGFRAHPYREYSEVFFGRGYRVLRGGSWATRPRSVDNRFRNWDLAERRQIFAGFRCAA
jgi:gamma-glutamyl hercynylcysteine S-oxide synthase